MKSICKVLLASLSLLLCSTLFSCGKGDLDYKKACAEKDWPKAYAIVDKLLEKTQELEADYSRFNGEGILRKSLGDSPGARKAESEYNSANENYERAIKYVVLQEALCVLEDDGERGVMRIVGIAKEHDAESWLYEELLDAAKKIGDEELVNRFEKIINGE